MKKVKILEITSSFSFKKNLGNYETADFWFSAKAESVEGSERRIARTLHRFCKQEVVKALNEYLQEKNPPKTVQSAEEEYANSLPPKKVFLKPWEKQSKDFMEKAHADFVASGRKIDMNEPVYAFEGEKGGKGKKVLINKEANTLAPE